MIGRAAYGLCWVTVIGLAAAGAYFGVLYAPQPPALESGAQQPHGSRRAPIDGRSRQPAETSGRVPRASRARRPGVSEASEFGPRAQDLRRLERERVRAESVARSFFSAFARYELGELDRRIAARLRTTATARFAGELIGSPPRLAPRAPAPATLHRLVFVAGAVGVHGELRSAELVGWVERGGRRSPIAIELVKARRGWRVSGIGR